MAIAQPHPLSINGRTDDITVGTDVTPKQIREFMSSPVGRAYINQECTCCCVDPYRVAAIALVDKSRAFQEFREKYEREHAPKTREQILAEKSALGRAAYVIGERLEGLGRRLRGTPQ